MAMISLGLGWRGCLGVRTGRISVVPIRIGTLDRRRQFAGSTWLEQERGKELCVPLAHRELINYVT
jgi:hypothetical protein